MAVNKVNIKQGHLIRTTTHGQTRATKKYLFVHEIPYSEFRISWKESIFEVHFQDNADSRGLINSWAELFNE